MALVTGRFPRSCVRNCASRAKAVIPAISIAATTAIARLLKTGRVESGGDVRVQVDDPSAHDHQHGHDNQGHQDKGEGVFDDSLAALIFEDRDSETGSRRFQARNITKTEAGTKRQVRSFGRNCPEPGSMNGARFSPSSRHASWCGMLMYAGLAESMRAMPAPKGLVCLYSWGSPRLGEGRPDRESVLSPGRGGRTFRTSSFNSSPGPRSRC